MLEIDEDMVTVRGVELARLVLAVIGPRTLVVVVSVPETSIKFIILVMVVGQGRATTLTIDSLLPLTLTADTGNVTLDTTVKTGRWPGVWMTNDTFTLADPHAEPHAFIRISG